MLSIDTNILYFIILEEKHEILDRNYIYDVDYKKIMSLIWIIKNDIDFY